MSRQRTLVAAGLVATMTGALALEHVTRPPPMPSYEATRASWRGSDATLLDRNGAVVQTLRLDYALRRLDWTPLAQVSPALPAAIVAAEDHRFATHGGVDALAVLGAVRDRLAGRATRGASTLEMQLAAQLAPSLRSGRSRRGILQKLRQMRAAQALFHTWTRDQVLEAYLNLVSFRGETQGIAAASQALFGRPPQALTAGQSWTLAALLPAPGAAAASIAIRACKLAAGELVRAEPVSEAQGLQRARCPELQSVALDALTHPPTVAAAPGAAPHLARRLLRTPGESVRSTLDARVQTVALRALTAQLARLDAEEVRDGAAVVVDNASGEVLAYVGSAGRGSRSAQVDGARALRQAGSTLKPFLYSLAIERGWITAASLIDDAPVALEAGPGLYLPQNYEHDFKGLVSVRTALAGSLNVPAVRTLLIAGIEPFRERLRTFGYVDGLTEPGAFYGYSLALGSAEVSLLEQVDAYRTLANGGWWSPLLMRMDEAAVAPRAVVSPGAAFIVGDILSDRGARAVTFDFDGPLSTPYWAAVKTGTSKNLRDNWCIGYTRRYTVGVWVGNFEGDPMRTVSGITGAAPAWREILDALEAGEPDAAPSPPAGVSRSHVQFTARTEPDRDEWFVDGTQLAQVTPARPTETRARLASPADGTFIAVDPDIPLDRQHVVLRAEPASAALRLRLDDRDVGSAKLPKFWTPLPGEHRLALMDAGGKEVDRVRFSVRGPR